MVKGLLVAVAATLLVWLITPSLVTAAGSNTGFLEVCKASDGSGVSGAFRFTVGTRTIEVPVGACSAPIQLPAGIVTVTEEPVAGVAVSGIAVSPPDRTLGTSVADRTATVRIVPGGVDTQTIVTFTNRSEVGILTVCKAAGSGIVAGTNFQFVAGGRVIAVPAGECRAGGSFPFGTLVSVAEVSEPDTRVAAIEVVPPNRMVGNPSLTDGTVTVAIGPIVTQVTFTNETVPTGFIEICKRSDSAALTGTFTFTVGGRNVDVAVGSCSGPLRVPEGVVTVTETARADALVTGISAVPASRLLATDLPGRTAHVHVVAGTAPQRVTVTFANQLRLADVKVCKVAGSGITLGAPFTFTVAGQPVTVPAGSCVLAGSFPINSLVQVSEAVPPGVEVAAIRVEPSERMRGVPDLRNGTVLAVTGPGVTEVSITNQTVRTSTTTSTPPPSTIVVPQVTTVPPPTVPTTTIPPVPTTTIVPPTVPTTTTTTAVPPPAVTTTTIPLLPPLPTLPTLPPLPIPTSVPLTTSTTSGVLATSTTVPPATTPTTAVPVPTTSSVTTVPLVTTTTAPTPFATTSSTVAVPTSTTVPPLSVPTTLPVVTDTDTGSTTTTAPPCLPVWVTTPTTGPTPTSPTVPCVPTSEMSPPTTIVGQLLQRASAPLSAARLALTGGATSKPLAAAMLAVLVGVCLLLLARSHALALAGRRGMSDRVHPTFRRRWSPLLSSARRSSRRRSSRSTFRRLRI